MHLPKLRDKTIAVFGEAPTLRSFQGTIMQNGAKIDKLVGKDDLFARITNKSVDGIIIADKTHLTNNDMTVLLDSVRHERIPLVALEDATRVYGHSHTTSAWPNNVPWVETVNPQKMRQGTVAEAMSKMIGVAKLKIENSRVIEGARITPPQGPSQTDAEIRHAVSKIMPNGKGII